MTAQTREAQYRAKIVRDGGVAPLSGVCGEMNMTDSTHSPANAGNLAIRRRPDRPVGALVLCAALAMLSPLLYAAAGDSTAADRNAVLALDKAYQKAVEQNDARTMARLLADDYVLVDGRGKRYTKADLVDDAAGGKTHYKHQEDSEQMVWVWGDTAVLTAKLWAQGIEDGKAVDYTLWFSDTYVKTPQGWRYVFGQASLPLPAGK